MKKVYLFGALSGLLLASCANDVDLGAKTTPTQGESDAISFNMKLGNLSRTESGLETVTNNFGVWSIKANDDAAFKALDLNDANMNPNVVINDYKVYYGTVPHYGSQWTYYTSDAPDSIPELQYLKYWDGSVAQNYFFGYAPHNTKHKDAKVTFTNDDSNGAHNGNAMLTFNGIKTTSDPNYKFLYSDAKVVNVVNDYINPTKGSTTDPKKVDLKFNYLLGQVRLAFWESIQGYSVELEGVKLVPAASYTGPTSFGVAGIPASYDAETKVYSLDKYVEGGAGTLATVKYFDSSYAKTAVSFTGVATSDESTYLDFAIPTGDLSTVKASPTLSPTTYNVVPNASVSPAVKNCGFQFVLNYKLKADDTNEVIHVKGARVFVPSDYTQWKRNTVYTYVFQITKNSSGTTTNTDPGSDPEVPQDALYPIIFDGLTIVDADTEETHWVVNQTLAFEHDVYVVAASGTQDVKVNLGYDVSKDNKDGKINWTSESGFTVENATTTASGTTSANTIKAGSTPGTYTLKADYYGTLATTKVVVGTWGTLSNETKKVDDPAFDITAPITLTDSDPHIVWTSSYPEVATVEYATNASGNQVGHITLVAAGQTTITATLGNKTVYCTVTVKDLVIANAPAISSMVTEKTYQLEVKYNDGTDTTDVTDDTDDTDGKKISYSVSAADSSEDAGCVTVSDTGLVTPKKGGIATITVRYDGIERTIKARVNQVIP